MRLSWDDLECGSVRRALAAPAVPSAPLSHALPQWTQTIFSIVSESSRPAPSAAEAVSEAPLPFEDVLEPTVRFAFQRLEACAATCIHLLSPDARRALQRSLLRRLCHHVAAALASEFDAERSPGVRFALRWLGPREAPPGTVRYHEFTRGLLRDGLAGFFQRNPVLARAIVIITESWIASSAEFLERLSQDRTGLSLTRVQALDADASDPHHGGRRVFLLALENRPGLVYKPRDVSGEAALHSFIEWCNAQKAPLDLRAPRVFCRKGYGWVERVVHEPLVDSGAARRYYRRAGALLAVLHLLGANDMHYENVMASGEFPVLIDAETLLAPDMPGDCKAGSASNDGPAARRLARSAQRTGMLPGMAGEVRAEPGFDASALGDRSGILPKLTRWRDVNSDAMRIVLEAASPGIAQLPTLKGEPVSARAYSDDVASGFNEMLHWLVDQKQKLLGGDGPLACFRSMTTRVVFRATAAYQMFLVRSLRPELLSSGIDRSIELEILARHFIHCAAAGGSSLVRGLPPKNWPVLAAEKEALEDLDIPYFSVEASSTALNLGAGREPISDFFATSGFDSLKARVSALSMKDVAEETAIVRASFVSAETCAAHSKRTKAAVPPCTTSNLLAAAESIARLLAEEAVHGENGSADWYGLVLQDDLGHFALRPMGASLYEGGAGTALFLAAFDAVRGASEYRGLVLNALRTAAQTAQRNTEMPIGGGLGLGSIVYALVRAAGFLRDPSLLDTARTVAAQITPDRIAADREFDVLSGSAGAILGLLTLHAALPNKDSEPAWLLAAEIGGRHLIASAVATLTGPKAWRINSLGPSSEPLAGMSHGAAGIAYALLRLYGATQNRIYLEAAREGLAYETTVFSAADGNWPDLRPSPRNPSYVSTWCHGASGIGLARLGGLPYFDEPGVWRDVEAALAATRAHCPAAVDHLCCGTFGLIETLLVGASVLDRAPSEADKLRAECLVHAGQALARGLNAGNGTTRFAPGFHRGLAGIGYQLLRLATPDILPSVLLWH